MNTGLSGGMRYEIFDFADYLEGQKGSARVVRGLS
jgi:hypothetical protein